jgi:hypothetical protein
MNQCFKFQQYIFCLKSFAFYGFLIWCLSGIIQPPIICSSKVLCNKVLAPLYSGLSSEMSKASRWWKCWCWRWRHYVSPKHWYLSTSPHCATSIETRIDFSVERELKLADLLPFLFYKGRQRLAFALPEYLFIFKSRKLIKHHVPFIVTSQHYPKHTQTYENSPSTLLVASPGFKTCTSGKQGCSVATSNTSSVTLCQVKYA